MKQIRIRGARTHNLADLSLDLPRDRLTVLTGLSGSGKSSLAFDTLFAEGQRRYVESLSAYARQFLARMEKPDVDSIEGLSPSIAIEQKSASHNPRSTVGTITEIHDYLRLLYARAGAPRCPRHGQELRAQTVAEMTDHVLALPAGRRILLIAPVLRERKGEHQELLQSLRAQGFLRARIDGAVRELDEPLRLDLRRKHTIEVVVDRLTVRPGLRTRLAESFETALRLGQGVACVAPMDAPDADLVTFSSQYACPHCGYSLDELEPRLFSFNSPVGACPECDGLGTQTFFDPAKVARAERSLRDGAVRGWDARNAAYFRMIRALARHFGFSLDTPFGRLPKRARDIILHGSQEPVRFEYVDAAGRRSRARHPFEGVLPIMRRRYRDTASLAVREELARYRSQRDCPACGGERLNEAARHVHLAGTTLPQLLRLPVHAALAHFRGLKLRGRRGRVAAKVVGEIEQRLSFLADVGLDYLSLERRAETLSGGEAQRIRLASQIGAGLVGVTYILDEPSIGLHQRDNARLLDTLERLRDLGNTVLMVEHDESAIRRADHVVDLGPGAGVHGGRVVAAGAPAAIERAPASLTGQYLSGRRRIPVPAARVPRGECLRVLGAAGNNLQGIDAELPLGLFTCVTGVSGSGKSTLINDTLYRRLAAHAGDGPPAPCAGLEGGERIDKVIRIDQSPIGRTPRSNPATYTGLFGPVRELYAEIPEARARGYRPGRFSFNVRGGRCEACQGDGMIRVEMHFLPDVYVPCDVCGGLRYNRETLDVRYRGRSIAEVLDMTVEAAREFFANIPQVRRKLDTLSQVGLDYLRLGQSATTLSGGEAQRIKLSRELSRRGTGRTLYILDEPTTGLHFHDIELLLQVLHRLRDRGNTVVVIEHNLDVIKTADWVLDLGPEGGGGGGRIVACGTPEQVARSQRSHTGRFLAPLLAAAAAPEKKTKKARAARPRRKAA